MDNDKNTMLAMLQLLRKYNFKVSTLKNTFSTNYNLKNQ